MIDFTEIDYKTDNWELFARDFLEAYGFNIVSSPDRGADGGKDLIVEEHIKGIAGKYSFRWLVSCKHFAQSKRSVSVDSDENNILDRVESFNADGFIGFYSTIPSAGLNTRLSQLKSNGKIKDFKFFDHKLIENVLISTGYSSLLMRFFPNSYKEIKPIQILLSEYQPLNCEECGKDLLLEEGYHKNKAMFVYVTDKKRGKEKIVGLYCACKGFCDKVIRQKYESDKNLSCAYSIELSDLFIPSIYLGTLFDLITGIQFHQIEFTEEALTKLKLILGKVAQRNMRYMTTKEKEIYQLKQGF